MYPVYAAFLASHNITETAAMKYFSPKTSLRFCMRYEVLLAENHEQELQPPHHRLRAEAGGPLQRPPHTAPGNERLKARYLLGCVYRDMGEAPAECFTITRTFNSMMRAR